VRRFAAWAMFSAKNANTQLIDDSCSAGYRGNAT
jgi:hypothetical protein